MTPKDKAIQLVEKYNLNENLYYSISEYQAKDCALIAVDEIIRHTYIGKAKSKNDDNSFEFWHEVKQEIIKL